MKAKDKKIIGWRESVSLPKFKIKAIKVKVDTGARTSSLHAVELEKYIRSGKEYIKFKVYPEQGNTKKAVTCTSQILEYRKVKSSNGQSELRPVILTQVQLLDEEWEIEITLTNRDEMGFRMLLGRSSIKKRFLVDAGRSFYSNKK